MARAKRHYIPGQIWHITHRCHKREFLLKFAQEESCVITLLKDLEWTHSIAVGSQPFVESVKELVRNQSQRQRRNRGTKGYQLREEAGGLSGSF